jgi:hypothetical protein
VWEGMYPPPAFLPLLHLTGVHMSKSTLHWSPSLNYFMVPVPTPQIARAFEDRLYMYSENSILYMGLMRKERELERRTGNGIRQKEEKGDWTEAGNKDRREERKENLKEGRA